MDIVEYVCVFMYRTWLPYVWRDVRMNKIYAGLWSCCDIFAVVPKKEDAAW